MMSKPIRFLVLFLVFLFVRLPFSLNPSKSCIIQCGEGGGDGGGGDSGDGGGRRMGWGEGGGLSDDPRIFLLIFIWLNNIHSS